MLLTMVIAAAAVAPARLRQTWREQTCRNQLHTLGLALAVYAHDSDGALPPTTRAFADYVCGGVRGLDYDFVPHGAALFHCPMDAHPPQLLAITNERPDTAESCRCSYDCRLSYPPPPQALQSGEPLMWDLDGGDPASARANHGRGRDPYGNVLYRDAHAERVSARLWPSSNRPPAHAGPLYPRQAPR